MSDDLINALKATQTSWDPLDDDMSYPLRVDVNDDYHRRAASLIKRWEVESSRIYDDSFAALVGFGEWLRDVHRLRIGPVSWRSYRYQCTQALPYADFRSIVDVPPATRKSSVAIATSRHRQRHLKEHALNTLKRHFSTSRSPLAGDIVDILCATLDTGLRPSEWASVELRVHNGTLPYLWVENAKKGSRMHNATLTHRPVPLSHLGESQMETIRNTIGRFKACDCAKSYQEQLLKVLGSAVRACFYGHKSRPTLYSARHQFAANLKATEISPDLIAVVMGHNSIELQTHHYGRKVNGTPILIRSQDIEELARCLLI